MRLRNNESERELIRRKIKRSDKEILIGMPLYKGYKAFHRLPK